MCITEKEDDIDRDLASLLVLLYGVPEVVSACTALSKAVSLTDKGHRLPSSANTCTAVDRFAEYARIALHHPSINPCVGLSTSMCDQINRSRYECSSARAAGAP